MKKLTEEIRELLTEPGNCFQLRIYNDGSGRVQFFENGCNRPDIEPTHQVRFGRSSPGGQTNNVMEAFRELQRIVHPVLVEEQKF